MASFFVVFIHAFLKIPTLPTLLQNYLTVRLFGGVGIV